MQIMAKKKVLHILNTGSYSGAENVVISIINNTKEEIDSVYLSKDGSIREILEENDILFYPVKKLSLIELRKAVKEIEPDIIHAHDFTASVFSAILNLKIPFISHIHNNASWIKKISFKTLAYAIACFKCEKILAVSSSIFDEYVFGGMFKSKVEVVGNPINVKDIILKSQVSSVLDKYDICYCGRLSIEKNPLFFVEIVNELKKKNPFIKACIIGDGQMRKIIEEKIRELNLEKNVMLLGFKKNPYVYIKNSKVVCIPSLWEGFGLAAVEALAIGVPVVCNPVGGLREIVTKSCGYMCCAKEDYVASIYNLLTNEKLYLQMSEAAINRAKELSNSDRYFKKLLLIYKKVERRL